MQNILNLEVDEQLQQKSTPRSDPVSQERESEATQGTIHSNRTTVG